MAKPPALLSKPKSTDLGDEQARAAARRRLRSIAKAKPKDAGGGGVQLFLFGLAFIGMAVFAAPTCVLVLFGMVPSLVSYFAERRERPMLAFTIAPINLAGLMPYLLELWTGADTMTAVIRLLTDVYVWLVIYLSAGAGWLLFTTMPFIVASFMQSSLDSRKMKLKTLQQTLRADWGAEVSGSLES
jgi:hypothetical protein